MFPRPHHPFEPAEKRSWRAGLRHALDVVVAFATLADGDPLTPSEPPAPRRSKPLVSARRAPSTSARSAPSDPHGAEPPAASRVAHPHPHRRALAAPARSRRPGAVRAAPQPCLTPLPARHTGRGRTLVPTR